MCFRYRLLPRLYILGNFPELVFGEAPFQIVGFQLDLSENTHDFLFGGW